MISTKMQDAINDQIQAELYSAYLYLAMSTYCESQNLRGFAHWLKLQHGEETEHAEKLMDYLLERGGKVVLKAIDAPPAEFGSPLDIFAQVLAHEQHVTERIHKLYELALAEKDYAAQIFLQWFITEQVEEEATAGAILERLRMIPEKSGALLYIDKELGKRE
ncbi:MAG: ferritin [Negativicutes bacterium]|nr:ferritin [Negativicutes bacterium]